MRARHRVARAGKQVVSDAGPRVLIVGAGPAGTRAAETLVEHGVAPVVVDEGARSGGQIYRQPPEGFTRPATALYGFEARKAQAVHAALAAVRDRLDYRPGTLIWSIEAGVAHTLGPTGVERIAFDTLILATGAMDRVIPFPGWTLPGVFTMGGAQVALKAQGCAIGDPVVFMGTGPLLYLVAYQYAHAGARVAAVLDTSRAGHALPVLPGLLWGGRTFAKGVWYMTWLRAAGIAVRRGIAPVAAEGRAALEAVRYRDRRGREHRVACTGLGIGYSVKSEVQLAELAGCEMAFDPLAQQWLPQADADGRALPGAIYLAGDGAGVAGADAAELRGRLAALALLADQGHRDGSRVASEVAGEAAAHHALPQRVGTRAAGSLSPRTDAPRRDRHLPLRGHHRRRYPPGPRPGAGGDEPGEGLYPGRHGPLPGPRVRPRRGPDPRGGTRLRRGGGRPPARSGAGQAARDPRGRASRDRGSRQGGVHMSAT